MAGSGAAAAPEARTAAKIGPHAGAIAATILGKDILGEDTRHDSGWTLGRLCAEIARRGGPAISPRWLSHQLRKRCVWTSGNRGTGASRR